MLRTLLLAQDYPLTVRLSDLAPTVRLSDSTPYSRLANDCEII